MNIGLVAHDSKKTLMQNFCIAYRGILSKHELYWSHCTNNGCKRCINFFKRTYEPKTS